MSCCHGVKSIRKCFFTKKIKFYPRITENIRVRGESFFVSFKNIVEDFLLIFFDKIEGEERYFEIFGHFFCNRHIGTRWTAIIFSQIVNHEPSTDIISLLFEQVRRNSRIYTARESDQYFFTGHSNDCYEKYVFVISRRNILRYTLSRLDSTTLEYGNQMSEASSPCRGYRLSTSRHF